MSQQVFRRFDVLPLDDAVAVRLYRDSGELVTTHYLKLAPASSIAVLKEREGAAYELAEHLGAQLDSIVVSTD